MSVSIRIHMAVHADPWAVQPASARRRRLRSAVLTHVARPAHGDVVTAQHRDVQHLARVVVHLEYLERVEIRAVNRSVALLGRFSLDTVRLQFCCVQCSQYKLTYVFRYRVFFTIVLFTADIVDNKQ